MYTKAAAVFTKTINISIVYWSLYVIKQIINNPDGV